jgi:hypothetical protein
VLLDLDVGCIPVDLFDYFRKMIAHGSHAKNLVADENPIPLGRARISDAGRGRNGPVNTIHAFTVLNLDLPDEVCVYYDFFVLNSLP